MAVTVSDITRSADAFRAAYPSWPHPEGPGRATTGELLTGLAGGRHDRAALLAELRSRGIHAGPRKPARPVGADREPGDLYGTEEAART